MIIIIKTGFDVSSSKDAFFKGRLPNGRHCACLSNKLLSNKRVDSILRHPIYIYIYVCVCVCVRV